MLSPKGELTNSKDTTVYVLSECKIPENETLLAADVTDTRSESCQEEAPLRLFP